MLIRLEDEIINIDNITYMQLQGDVIYLADTSNAKFNLKFTNKEKARKAFRHIHNNINIIMLEK